MRSKIFYILLISSSLFSNNYDIETDAQIISILKSAEFSNSMVNYSFNNSQYPIRIVHNPDGENLWCKELLEPVGFHLLLFAALPLDLAYHIENICINEGVNEKAIDSDLRGNSVLSPTGWSLIRPYYVASKFDDSVNNAKIQEIFNSSTHKNEVLLYKVAKEYYFIRLVHNPQKNTFRVKKTYVLDRKKNNLELSWKKKYGIFINNPVPQKYIDYIVGLLDISYWDWYFNLDIENGTPITYIKTCYYSGDEIEYEVDSWFSFADYFTDNSL